MTKKDLKESLHTQQQCFYLCSVEKKALCRTCVVQESQLYALLVQCRKDNPMPYLCSEGRIILHLSVEQWEDNSTSYLFTNARIHSNPTLYKCSEEEIYFS